MTRILVVTRAFPYLPGEQFVEPEAPFWRRDDAEVVVMPRAAQGEPRPMPEGVTVDLTLTRITAAQRRRARLHAVTTGLFWRELGWLARHKRLNRGTAVEVVRSVGGALVYAEALAAWIEQNGPVDVVYTYWWDVWTYGAQLLRGKRVGHVVSRTHRYDLYEDRAACGFLALKRSLGRELDRLLTISHDGSATARQVYGLPDEVVQLSPLGVRLPEVSSATSPQGELHLVSTAAMAPVKRIDRLVDALGVLCREQPGLQVHWTHFGDGELRDELQHRLDELGNPPQLHVQWPGNVANEALREHFASHPVDVFVNTSESEGVPVSIMEAMAFGVPALAPAVGGIGDIIPADGPGGQLLSASPDGDEVAAALADWATRGKQQGERDAARAIVAERYDEAKNYTGLMDELVAMGR